MLWIAIAAAGLVLAYAGRKLGLKLKDKREASNVVRFSLDRKSAKRASLQSCSFCRKKTKRLTFYADEQGKVTGVCELCREVAERRALLRL